LFAQQNQPENKQAELSLDKGTIENQFEYLMTKSTNYKEYKVIKVNWMNKFRGNVNDTLEAVHNQINGFKKASVKQNKEIQTLKTELDNVKNNLNETQQAKDSMMFFGMQMSKGSYNTVMWFLIIVALALAGVCFMLFKRSNVVTVETKNRLDEIQEEFDTHRKNALLREQKLARRLQDEVIKNKNLGL
jgi:septal ring factor EnvC (AmiA/AmiB activator)